MQICNGFSKDATTVLRVSISGSKCCPNSRSPTIVFLLISRGVHHRHFVFFIPHSTPRGGSHLILSTIELLELKLDVLLVGVVAVLAVVCFLLGFLPIIFKDSNRHTDVTTKSKTVTDNRFLGTFQNILLYPLNFKNELASLIC